jgi:hypothetical protein
VIALLAVLVAGALPAEPTTCGTKALYGRTLTVRVIGKPLPCSDVRSIVKGSCDTNGKTWSCFSPREPGPALIWFRSRERFKERWSTTIEAVRPNCKSTPGITHADWIKPDDGAFPSRQQILGDDLLRCHRLDRMTHDQAVALLGKPEDDDGKEADWEVGLERDSFFQVDSEYLVVSFAGGKVTKASFEQG